VQYSDFSYVSLIIYDYKVIILISVINLFQSGQYTVPQSGKSPYTGGSDCGEGIRYSWPNTTTSSTQGESWRDPQQARISCQLPSLSKSSGKSVSDMFSALSLVCDFAA
jgi:hypothetical protein